MPAVFSNKPRFCQKHTTVQDAMSLKYFNAAVESASANPGLNQFATNCGDPNLGTTFRKNIIHQVIRCGGKDIDINWMEEMYGNKTPLAVGTKEFYNHYVCDTDLNVFAAARAVGTTPGGTFVMQLLKGNHSGSGQFSAASKGFILWDKDNMIKYTIVSVDTSTPYAHKLTLQPNDVNVTGSIKINTPYLIVPAREVGGYSCKSVVSTISSIGYTQKLSFLRVRRDWEIQIDLLRGYRDDIQYAVIYDINGKPQDSWTVKEAQDARTGVRMALNVAAFIGTPTTNSALVGTGANATVDEFHTGFYGLLPNIKYGGGIVQDVRTSVGLDFEADMEPIFLYQDSLKRSSRFMGMVGQEFLMNMDSRTNKLVLRTGQDDWEGYRRLGSTYGADGNVTEVAKLGVSKYTYRGFGLDTKKIDAFSDKRFFGTSYYSNLAILMPMDGVQENGRDIDPLEFYSEGIGEWNGNYEEHYVDNRDQTEMCDSIQGSVAQSMGFAMHCPEMWVLLNPVMDS